MIRRDESRQHTRQMQNPGRIKRPGFVESREAEGFDQYPQMLTVRMR
jgi:hypothetical protein